MSENRKGSITSNRSISVGGDKGKLAKVNKTVILIMQYYKDKSSIEISQIYVVTTCKNFRKRAEREVS